MHVPGTPLVLPNALDAASARMVEAAGFPAVATSSAATAADLGYDDGEAAPVEEVLAAAALLSAVAAGKDPFTQ
nr:isocitrate lyase/phosphoenolpyruvate mutase family protein [Jiangella aurantiaca]